MRTRTVAVLLATLLVATTVAEAQGGGGRRGGMGGGRGGPMGARGERPDPLLLAGPPAPDSIGTIASLDTAQGAQYATLYERFMKNTKADRDELRDLRGRMREARQNQDRSAAMQQMEAARELTDRLRKDQKVFDESLKSLLDQEQWKAYEKWRKDARKQMEEAQRSERGRP